MATFEELMAEGKIPKKQLERQDDLVRLSDLEPFFGALRVAHSRSSADGLLLVRIRAFAEYAGRIGFSADHFHQLEPEFDKLQDPSLKSFLMVYLLDFYKWMDR